MVPASSSWELLLRQLKIPFLSRRASHWYEWKSACAEGWRMDKEIESLWQGARGCLNSQIAEASCGISCTVRTGCRVNSACAEAYVWLWFCPLQLRDWNHTSVQFVLHRHTELTSYSKSFRFGQLLFGLPCIYQSILLSLQVITY